MRKWLLPALQRQPFPTRSPAIQQRRALSGRARDEAHANHISRKRALLTCLTLPPITLRRGALSSRPEPCDRCAVSYIAMSKQKTAVNSRKGGGKKLTKGASSGGSAANAGTSRRTTAALGSKVRKNAKAAGRSTADKRHAGTGRG
jgi:hypothetical protein